MTILELIIYFANQCEIKGGDAKKEANLNLLLEIYVSQVSCYLYLIHNSNLNLNYYFYFK